MNELESRLNAVLSDPGALNRLAGMAQQLMAGADRKEEPRRESDPLGEAAARLLRGMKGAGSAPLLDAVGPYLDEARRSRLERALRLASAARLAAPALREIGGFRGL